MHADRDIASNLPMFIRIESEQPKISGDDPIFRINRRLRAQRPLILDEMPQDHVVSQLLICLCATAIALGLKLLAFQYVIYHILLDSILAQIFIEEINAMAAQNRKQ